MKPYVRPFQKNVYDEVDTPSKKALVKILKSEGHEIVSSHENYYADIVSQKDGVTYYHEVERKAQWGKDYLKKKKYKVTPESGWPFSWKELRIPGRKKRLIEKYKDEIENLSFYVFNFEYDKAWKVKATQMTDDTMRKPDFARVHESETFYHIPYTEAELLELS